MKLYSSPLRKGFVFQSADPTVSCQMQLLDNYNYALKRQANFFKINKGISSYLNLDWIVKILYFLFIYDLICFTVIFKNATSHFCLIT